MNTTDTYLCAGAALRAFQIMTGFMLDHDMKKEVGALVEKNNLSKAYVAKLAAEVIAADYRSACADPVPSAGFHSDAFAPATEADQLPAAG